MPQKILTMKLLKDRYAVCRLNKTDLVPPWAMRGEFFSVTRTQDELSIVCPQNNISKDIKLKCERDWRILKIEGVLDFSLVGILSSISTLLAQKGISIFAISTYDTDYILVKEQNTDKAVMSLTNEGYEVIK